MARDKAAIDKLGNKYADDITQLSVSNALLISIIPDSTIIMALTVADLKPDKT